MQKEEQTNLADKVMLSPKRDPYLYGRFCDYYHLSKEITERGKRGEALRKMSEYYKMPVTRLRFLIEKKRIEVEAKYPIP